MCHMPGKLGRAVPAYDPLEPEKSVGDLSFMCPGSGLPTDRTSFSVGDVFTGAHGAGGGGTDILARISAAGVDGSAVIAATAIRCWPSVPEENILSH